MPMLRTIERPTSATRRSCACAASSTCCTRCTCEANDATMIRLVESANTWSRTGPMPRSCATKPGHLGVGGVDHEQVDALLAEPRERAQVGDAAVERQLVHLEVAGVQDGAGAGVRTATARASGIEWFTATNSHSNAPNCSRCPSRDLARRRLDAVLLELGLDERERELGADERDVAAQAQQVRHGADVVLVAVREDDRLDVVEPVLDVLEVGQDQVDAGLVVLGEQDAAVDDEQAAGVLEDGHVAADLSEATQCDDAQGAVRRAAGGRVSSGCG